MLPRVPMLVLMAATASLPALPTSAAITIGPGAAIGTDRASVVWYEEFQDWTRADLKALDETGTADLYAYGDGYDDSRDLVAFCFREEGASLFFRADFFDLALGAENTALDVFVAIDAAPGGQEWLPDFLDCRTTRPWEMCVVVDRAGSTYGTDYRIYDASFADLPGAYLGAHFNSELDAVEFGVTRQSLLDAGWDGVTPPAFQVFTARDGAETGCTGGGFGSDLTDAMTDDDRGCTDGTLDGAIFATDAGGFVRFATIAHGNQSVARASEVGAHIYDPESNTGIPGGTGFQRTLDTHGIFRVPLNIHPSGTLTIACSWAATVGGAADPADGPSFLARIRDFVDDDQANAPGSLLGGVLAEHILPYFEGPVNAASFAAAESLNAVVYGVTAADAPVMHTPERVIRSLPTGLSPLDGLTFEDLAASPYTATVLDEVTHLHHWFYPEESCLPDAGYRHKIHRTNGVNCFLINEAVDGRKFANDDGGMERESRALLLEQARAGDPRIVVVFDDWEALGGKSFGAVEGTMIPNNNPNQYHRTIRWAANRPWIAISNLDDILEEASANPGAFVIDHGTRTDLSLRTYEWLAHAAEDSYHHWYYNDDGGSPGNEQSFYDLVPVITGPQGSYHSRGATPADDGPPLSSGMPLGDLNTPGTLLHEAWSAISTAPAGRLREVGTWGFLAMIYETAWHEEDETDYTDTDCYGNWTSPDATWDGVSSWALRLQNHAREAGIWAAAADWAEAVRTGSVGAATVTEAADLDFDGEDEFVVRNARAWAAFEARGGRCVAAAAFDPVADDGVALVGPAVTIPSAPGEEEYADDAATRCSAFKETNGGAYADAVYPVTPIPGGWRFSSPDGKVTKSMTLADGSGTLRAGYVETVAGALFVRMGLSPNPLDLAFHGHAHLSRTLDAGANAYALSNSSGGTVVVRAGSGAFVPAPAYSGWNRRDVGLTEEVEISADGAFVVEMDLLPETGSATSVESGAVHAHPGGLVRGVFPSPGSGPAWVVVSPRAAAVATVSIHDAGGRRLATRDAGRIPAGVSRLAVPPVDNHGQSLPAGVYFVRVITPGEIGTQKWVIVR
ncbi:MAG: FlgD immunoglobulin-like domain containing protein [Gemmatimonadota bacterium]|nr:FlgD immunoglobulin-like domain containing protein [Gemmatimonadota bacterium]MDP7032217.1 FlgD immunoglobulin-like domain containing protein [Gemmatimonadota bacterium]